jgi:hypothetical protein
MAQPLNPCLCLLAVLTRSLISGSLLLAAAGAPAQAPTAVPAGTEVTLRLKQELRSGRSKKGDRVACEVAADVRSADGARLLIPAGAPAVGSVLESRRPGPFGRPGRLTFACRCIQLADGSELPLESLFQSRVGRDRQAVATGSGVVMGAGAALGVYAATFDIFGDGPNTGGSAAAGVGVFAVVAALQRGKNATAREGYEFQVKVARETPVPPAARRGD